MRSRRLTDRAFKLSTLALALACSQEKKRDPGEPTPFELYVASERLKGGFRTPADTSRSTPVNTTTGDIDHDFLRAMSNHHKDVIVLADAALEANTRPDMESVIRRLEERHAHELDAMTSILRKTYKDAFISSPSAQTKATAGTLRQPGSDYRRLFLDAAVKAEDEGSRLAGLYLLRTKRTDVDQLADEIKTNETQDLVALKKRLAVRGQRQ